MKNAIKIMYYHLVYEQGNKGYLLATFDSWEVAVGLKHRICEMADFVNQHLDKEYNVPTAIGTPEKVYDIISHEAFPIPENEYITAIFVYRIKEDYDYFYILESNSKKFIPEKLKRRCLSE